MELVAQVGLAEAGRQTGIPKSTIMRWCRVAGVATCSAEKKRQVAHANAEQVARWEQRRVTLIHELGESAARAHDRVREALEGGDAKIAKEYALTLAILVDKAEVLAGRSGPRLYGSDDQRQQVIADGLRRAVMLGAELSPN